MQAFNLKMDRFKEFFADAKQWKKGDDIFQPHYNSVRAQLKFLEKPQAVFQLEVKGKINGKSGKVFLDWRLDQQNWVIQNIQYPKTDDKNYEKIVQLETHCQKGTWILELNSETLKVDVAKEIRNDMMIEILEDQNKETINCIGRYMAENIRDGHFIDLYFDLTWSEDQQKWLITRYEKQRYKF